MTQLLPPITRRPADVPRRELPDDVVRLAWQVISLCLEYPTEDLFGSLPAARLAAARLPAAVGEPLTQFMTELERLGLAAAQRDYVDTFDYTRKCALHLTYYTYGDSRKRGVALVQFKQAYRKAGLEVTDDELPDHLSIVLDAGAAGALEVAWDLLNRHRVGIELLALGLESRRSIWHPVVAALQASLPAVDGAQAAEVERLLREGPETEDVGLEPYGIDPLLQPEPFNPYPRDDLAALGV